MWSLSNTNLFQKLFTVLYSNAACIEAGGRLPKSQTKQFDEAID